MRDPRSWRYPLLAWTALALVASGASAQAPEAGVILAAEGATILVRDAGSSATFHFSAKNTNPLAQEVVFLVQKGGAPGWEATFTPASTRLEGSESKTVKLTVAIPANAQPGLEVPYSVMAKDPTTGLDVSPKPLTFNVSVAKAPAAQPVPKTTPRFTLTLETPRLNATAGGDAATRLIVRAHDVPPNGLALRFAAALPSGWPASSITGLESFRTFYPSASPVEMALALRVPNGLAADSVHAIVISASASDGAAAPQQVTLEVRVVAPPPTSDPTPPAPQPGDEPPADSPAPTTTSREDAPPAAVDDAPPAPADDDLAPPVGLLLTLDKDVLDVAAGDYLIGSLRIENVGDADRHVALTSDLGSDWALTFEGSGTVAVPAGQVVTVSFSILAPRDAAEGATTTALIRADEAADELTVRVVAPPAAPEDVAETTAAENRADAPLDRFLATYGTTPLVAAAGAAAAGAGALWVGGSPTARRKLWWVLVGLYTRLTRPKLLDHPERERLHSLIEAQPGIHFHALQRELGWNTGALTYHLRVLERHQLITSRRDGILRRFYLVGTAPRTMPVAVAPDGVQVSLSGLRGNVLNTVKERGRIAQSALAEELGASKQTLNYHVKNLERLGLLRVERVGRDTVLSLADAPDADGDDRGPAFAGASPPPFAYADGGFSRADEYR